MKYLILISRILTAIVFIVSGFSKAVDPVGTEIKLAEYFGAMGMDFMKPAAMFFGYLLNTAEFSVGILLLIKSMSRLAIWGALAFMVIFTPLTFWLAVANPVTDCGCFGDFIKLSNWETFYKNVVIISIVIFLFLTKKQITDSFSGYLNYISAGIVVVLVLGFQIYNYLNLPIIDFRPYKEGTDILEKSTIPEGAPQDVYESVLIYKNLKTGEDKEFSESEAYPWDDTLNWEFVDTKTKLVTEGYKPPIHDFLIDDMNKKNISKRILNNPDVSFILISPNFNKAGNFDQNKVNEIAKFAKSKNLKFYCFTATPKDDLLKFTIKFEDNIEFCTADKKMLMTFIRSNPGFVILEKGVIKAKYHYRNIPDIKKIESKFLKKK